MSSDMRIQRIEVTVNGITYRKLNDAALFLKKDYRTLRDQILQGKVKEGDNINGCRIDGIKLLSRKEYETQRYYEERMMQPIEYWLELDKFWWEKRT